MTDGSTKPNEATRIRDELAAGELAAGPVASPAGVPAMAERARMDAMDLAVDVRDLAPQQVWGRLSLWAAGDLSRLMAACMTLAAMLPVDTPAADLLEWTKPFQLDGLFYPLAKTVTA